MKPERAGGTAILLVGVVLMIWGIYSVVTSNFIAANIPAIVASGFAVLLYGCVLLVTGVVVSGFRNWIALGLHLAAILPYYLAIQVVITTSVGLSQEPGPYLSASLIFWVLGIALNVAGIVMNRVKAGMRKGLVETPAQAEAAPETPVPAPPSGPSAPPT